MPSAIRYNDTVRTAAFFKRAGNVAFRTGTESTLGQRIARWVRPASTFERLLALRPRPLINPDARLIVLFTPKAACTNVVMWFFHHMGQADAVRAYSAWPHEYRQQVYYRSALYRDACRLDLSKFTVVKIIRDPLERAESAFRHGLVARIFEKEFAKRGEPINATQGLSFDQYLTFLEGLDLTSCDPHFALQRHPVEDVLAVDHLINVSTEDLSTRLAEVEQTLGLPTPGPELQDWRDTMQRYYRPKAELARTDDLSATRFTRTQARNGPWPAAGAFINENARQRLEKLYAADIRCYLRGPLAAETSTS